MDEDREQRKIKKIMEIDLTTLTRELHSLTVVLNWLVCLGSTPIREVC